MSRKLSQKVRSEHLFKAFLSAWKAHIKRTHQQILRKKRNLRRDGLHCAANESSSSDSEPTGSVTLQGPSTASGSDSHLDTSSTTSLEDSLHSQSMRSSKELEDQLTLMIFDEDDSDLEEDSESADDESGESDDDKDESGNEVDNEEFWADAELGPSFRLGIAKWVKKSIKQMYSMHYKEPHDKPVPQPLA
ncbi:hypothetical protein PILCRDRAFT_9551 [Piloderma croceum F 1598]|uniref:Uncharacterized protein n=1 Tax=Piloderma croceum (strain F 1598) TaxID=765440 RepID=A0A0C3F6Q2_PILCF|nr:hypothetical protein PILCRDRAFT_9551 [Piloderma croceum F 1598]